MQFCKVCDNMLYLQIEGAAFLYCRNCSSEQKFEQTGRLSRREFKASAAPPVVNSSMKYDPTLPISSQPCPQCKGSDVRYVRYDHANLKYVHLCVECDHSWTNTQTPESRKPGTDQTASSE